MENINIEYVEVEALNPSEYNPRSWDEKAIEDLQKSIKEFGFVDPIICNKNPARANVVVGGHFRLYVAKLLGIEKVPVVWVDIEDIEREKKLNLRLNKNVGTFDWLKVKNILSEEGLLEVGFSDAEIAMMNSLANEEIHVDESPLKHELSTYLEGSIKQIVLFFTAEQYEELIPRLEKLREQGDFKNYSELFLASIEEYENNHNSEDEELS